MRRRKRMMAELDRDIREHIERETQDNIERGMSPEEARRAARLKFGNVALVREDTRAVWTTLWLEQLWRDVRYAVRMLRKSPGFTAIAVLTLAVGIGASATVFSWVRGVLLDPLPGIPHASQLVAVETVMPNGKLHTSSYPDFRDFRRENRVFSGMIGFELTPVDMSWAGAAQDRRTWGEIVTENYFQVLGVQAERGRVFQASDVKNGLGGDPYIVLSHGFWKRQFGGAAFHRRCCIAGGMKPSRGEGSAWGEALPQQRRVAPTRSGTRT